MTGRFRCKCVFVLIVMGRASCIGCLEASNFLKDFVTKTATTLFHLTLDIDLRSSNVVRKAKSICLSYASRIAGM